MLTAQAVRRRRIGKCIGGAEAGMMADGEQSRSWGRLIPTWALVLVFGVGVVLLLWQVPQWQAADVLPTPDDPNARLTAENELRRTMATVIAGAFVLVTGFLTWRNV